MATIDNKHILQILDTRTKLSGSTSDRLKATQAGIAKDSNSKYRWSYRDDVGTNGDYHESTAQDISAGVIADGQIGYYNSDGELSGDSGIKWDKNNSKVTLTGSNTQILSDVGTNGEFIIKVNADAGDSYISLRDYNSESNEEGIVINAHDRLSISANNTDITSNLIDVASDDIYLGDAAAGICNIDFKYSTKLLAEKNITIESDKGTMTLDAPNGVEVKSNSGYFTCRSTAFFDEGIEIDGTKSSNGTYTRLSSNSSGIFKITPVVEHPSSDNYEMRLMKNNSAYARFFLDSAGEDLSISAQGSLNIIGSTATTGVVNITAISVQLTPTGSILLYPNSGNGNTVVRSHLRIEKDVLHTGGLTHTTTGDWSPSAAEIIDKHDLAWIPSTTGKTIHFYPPAGAGGQELHIINASNAISDTSTVMILHYGIPGGSTDIKKIYPGQMSVIKYVNNQWNATI